MKHKRAECDIFNNDNYDMPYGQKGSTKMDNNLIEEPVWSKICELFDIEKVKTAHSNLSNPLFAVVRRLEWNLKNDMSDSSPHKMEILSDLNRFFCFFEKSKIVSDANSYLFNLYAEDYNKFAERMMLLVQMIIAAYPEYYY